MEKTAQNINILGRFCGKRDIEELTAEQLYKAYGISQADVMVLFGGSILCGGDVLAQAMQNHIAKKYVIVGGAGHTTETLRVKMHEEFPAMETAGQSEAQVFAGYLKQQYGLEPDLLECKSTNCGNNITYLLDLLKENGIAFRSIILSQDATMQHRMEAGLRKYVGEEIQIINYAVYDANVIVKDGVLAYEKNIWGMWDMERYISLLLGEIPRLSDDENGYGPRGKDFIAHVDIPDEIQKAFAELCKEYSGLVREANPLFASKKKIAMFTMGTRGDVQPYIYLARALNRAGYEVTLGSHPCWRELIEKAGISFAPVGPDINIEKEAAVIRGKNSNPVFSMLKTVNFVFKIIQNSTSEIYEGCKEKDLIIVSHSQMGATEAEVLGIPTVNVTLQTEMIAEKLKQQSRFKQWIGNLIGAQTAKPYNKIRKVYGLPKIKSADEMISNKLDLIPISRYVKERNPYWEEQHILTGYWYEEEKEYIPEKGLADFLENGDKPIILALGAMSFEDKEESDKLVMFIKAFQKTGRRAVIQGFQKTLENYELPDTMIACGSVPHSWLFQQGYCVIHHCGFGTASATMIYGIPSIPIPHVLDQMGFADELCKLGISTRPIQSKDLSEERIIEAITEMQQTYEEKKKKVEEISRKIQSENGLQRAVELIGNLVLLTSGSLDNEQERRNIEQ